MEKKRLDFLDIAKGIGIILVLYSHSCGFPIFGNAFVAFYMPLFFFVSGYVYREGRTPAENIKRKLKQLLLPYAGYTLLLYAEHILVNMIKHELTGENIIMPLLGALYSRAALYADMTGDNVYFLLLSNGPLWFITAMASGCVIFYLLVDRFLKNKKDMMVITVVLIAITALFTYCPYLLPWSIDTASAVALFMLMGAKLGQIQYFGNGDPKKFGIIPVSLAALVYCLVTQMAQSINMSIREFGYHGIVGALWFLAAASFGVLIFLWICRYVEKFRWSRIFILLGKHTYSIMALHIVIIKYLSKIYYIFKMQFEFSRECIWYWVYWTVLFVITILICISFDRMLDFVKNKIKE
ncbi:MAG: acyltransferase family protein [Lachnospiraceae bacterium]